MPRRQLVPDDERLRMYRMGLSDAELARLWGLSPMGVKDWRERHGLPAHRKPRADRGVPRGPRRAFTPLPCKLPDYLELPQEPEDFRPFWAQRVADGAILVDRRREVVPWLVREEERAS